MSVCLDICLSDGTSESLVTWQVEEVVLHDFLLAEPSCASASRSTARHDNTHTHHTHLYTYVRFFILFNDPLERFTV